MTDFNRLCKEFEEMDVLSYGAILAAKSVKVIPALAELSGDSSDGITIYAMFILGAIAADGRLTEEEYLLVYPMLHAMFGDEIDYPTCKAAVRYLRPESKELKLALNDMVDIFGKVSDDLKDDLILITMMICAVDGKISAKEKNWIKTLIA